MKKSLLALAVLSAFAGAASAQSSVTLYGRVDAGYTRFDPKQGTTTNVGATSGLAAGNLGGNRFGLRGSEDLGGGLRGIFALESGFALDTGATAQGDALVSSRLFGRQAYLGVTGGLGSLVMGRLAAFSSGTGDFDKFGSLDPFRTGAGILGFQKVMSSANALRLDNAVAYVSPNLSGFSAGVGYTWNYSGGEASGGSGVNNTGYVSYINYSSGPFYAVVTYDDFKLGTLTGDPSQSHLQAGLSWDFKVAKVSFAYAREKDQFIQGVAGACITGDPTVSGGCTANAQRTNQAAGADADAWALGLIVPFGAHSVRAAYHSRGVDAVGTTPSADRTGWSLGYEYVFSRRTTAYVYYGDVSDKDAYKISNWGGATQGFIGLSHAF
ncbi:MAG: porin [Burkholderiales bacterium]|nr:porin [Burkholderiales bacterium]